MSSPSFSCSVARTSISVSTPNPCAASASRTRRTASGNGTVVRTLIPYSTCPPRSGQGEEQLFHLLLGHRRLAVGGQALLQAAGHYLEPGPVQGPGHRRQLRHDFGAVAAVLDHRDDPGQLALRPAEPVEHRARGLLVYLHQPVLPLSNIIPYGVYESAGERCQARPGRLRPRVLLRRSGFPWREAVAAPGTPMVTPGHAGSLAAAPCR